MFCDLVDSTGIAAKLDVEELRDLVGAYIDACRLLHLLRLKPPREAVSFPRK